MENKNYELTEQELKELEEFEKFQAERHNGEIPGRKGE